MGYVDPCTINKAREMDLLTYLQNYEPQELISCGKGTFCTREHDSLKISNGKWFWFSRGIGGKSALDYLVNVKDVPFTEAVEIISGKVASKPPLFISSKSKPSARTLLLPKVNRYAQTAVKYLTYRGIDRDIINYCIGTDRLYESYPYHNVVFVGQDKEGKPRYANIRGVGTDFKGEATGSDKRFSFSLPAQQSTTLHVFESAIDLLSFATMQKRDGKEWDSDHLISLAGVYQPKKEIKNSTFPLALRQFLSDYPEIKRIILRLDNDPAGRTAMNTLYHILSEEYGYDVSPIPPPSGKDYNDSLCDRLGLPRTVSYRKIKSR